MVTSTTASELKDKIDSLESEIKTMHKELEKTASTITDQNLLNPLKSILYKMVCDSIKELIARKSNVSIDEVGSLLSEWGLSLKNREAGKRIQRHVPPWTEEEHAIVTLKDVTYKNSNIVFPLDERRISLGAKLLPFATSAVLEEIKDIFEGNLEILHDMTLSFGWDSELDQLKIVRKYKLKSISTDDASLKLFERIHELKQRLSLPKLKAFLSDIPKVSKPVKGQKETKEKAKAVTRSSKVDLGYDTRCIDILINMQDECYITNRDFWFKIGDVLIWEEPRRSKATYIFKWPEEPLPMFIFMIRTMIRVSSLEVVREYPGKKDPASGYKDKVIHDKNISNWEKNLKNKI
jgi:hypothetical protein